MITVNDILWRYALLAGFDGDGNTMFVAAADEEDLLTLATQVAGIDVGRNVHTSQMADVYGSVGVRQRRSDGMAFVGLVGICQSILVYVMLVRIGIGNSLVSCGV